MEINIRKAERQDCPRLLELITELAIYEKAPNDVTVTMEHFVESGFGNTPVWWAFVAETPASGHDPAIIHGFALYYVRYSTWKGQAMYLEDIIVTESMRGKKIGKLLFDRLIEEAKERKWNRIIWQVLEWNEPAINFYRKYEASFDGEWVNCTLYVDKN
ncbi:MAG: GNAT family N-acetyltransferase [Chitinophagaceae bacterium]|nr:GNAT family N-acetyltransferase [Chitinophagaceae bacterium]